MANKNNHLAHRGRFQAQGGGVEESEKWAQDEPLSLKRALILLARLIAKLATKDYKRRKNQLTKPSSLSEMPQKLEGCMLKLANPLMLKVPMMNG